MSGNDLSGSRLMLVLLFLVSMVSVVAVIVAAVSLTNSGSDTPNINVNSGPQSGGGASAGGSSGMPIIINSGGRESSSASGKRTFMLAIGHDFGGHDYLDEKGYIQGFMKDLVFAVCETGGMDCRLIWDQYTNCWDSEVGKHGTGGKGLFNGWYDACSGWAGTISRVQVFDFSLPFSKQPSHYFWIQNTAGNSFDTADITGKTIGFMDGWTGDEKCVARQTSIKGSVLPIANIKHYAETPMAVQALKDGEVHALFGIPSAFGAYEGVELKKASDLDLMCANSGFAMMTPKDNDFNSYWNAAFQKYKDSGKFRQLCEQAKEKHGEYGEVADCVDAP